MARSAKDLTGQTFGILQVTGRSAELKSGKVAWNVRCGCGNLTQVRGSSLVSGHTRSCGTCGQRHSAKLTVENAKYRIIEHLGVKQAKLGSHPQTWDGFGAAYTPEGELAVTPKSPRNVVNATASAMHRLADVGLIRPMDGRKTSQWMIDERVVVAGRETYSHDGDVRAEWEALTGLILADYKIQEAIQEIEWSAVRKERKRRALAQHGVMDITK